MSTAARDIFHVFNKMRGEKGSTTAVGGKKRQSFGLRSIVVLFVCCFKIYFIFTYCAYVGLGVYAWVQVPVEAEEEAGCSKAGVTGRCGVDVGAGSWSSGAECVILTTEPSLQSRSVWTATTLGSSDGYCDGLSRSSSSNGMFLPPAAGDDWWSLVEFPGMKKARGGRPPVP